MAWARLICVMAAEVPEDMIPSDENEDLNTERPKLQFLQVTEDIEPGSVAEAGVPRDSCRD